MSAKKDSHRHTRAKRLIAGSKGSAASNQKISTGKSTGLSGAMPTTFPVGGNSPKKRLDKKRRYASGGGIDDDAPKKKAGAKTEVNIIIAGKGDQSPPRAVPVPIPPPGAAGIPPRPPMMPPGGAPPQGMPMRPPGAMKRGGGIKEPKYPIDAGSGGGKGRLEKAAAEKRQSKSGKPK